MPMMCAWNAFKYASRREHHTFTLTEEILDFGALASDLFGSHSQCKSVNFRTSVCIGWDQLPGLLYLPRGNLTQSGVSNCDLTVTNDASVTKCTAHGLPSCHLRWSDC
ncbi:hypothetical protein SCLCIDRAFT_451929 [Scleroderma citrinum Foug A]|uniref:Uncharacterized protein n=1 Tax=Scleroderma citrinum Foug A TaxID=1036808 RepID=A0A0C2YUH4_9AGAM|nr:hypothetical protein SCLCIDRAFT_451929 [Scleroderma citrinum Foug A]